jgi:DNA-directed RNA polymerase specialized sigma24 family protein
MEPRLTPDLFNNLLIQLDPTGKDPGKAYESIRRRLIKFFEWRGCSREDELADATIDRVASLLGDGRVIACKDAFSFFYGVARNILRESWTKNVPISVDQVAGWIERFPDPRATQETDSENENRLACLETCAAHLSDFDRMLIVQYYVGDKSVRIANRRKLAGSMGISLNALRIRAYRIRSDLEHSVARCTAASREKVKR